MSEFVETHLPCPDCGSSDALSINEDGWKTCFSCQKRTPPEGEVEAQPAKSKTDKPLIPFGSYQDLPRRKLKEETCAKYGYFIGEDAKGQTVQVAQYRDADGRIVGQKVRNAKKEFLTTGDFKSVVLFGQHLWKTGGRRVVVTEGEIDCLSLAQALGLSWPVVSLPNGASSARKALSKVVDWLSSYEEVVLCFDMDDVGQKAATDCISLLPPGKLKIAQLPLKDANEMLVAGRVKELVSAIWEAQVRRPDGIICGADIWEHVSRPVVMGTPYPWHGLNRMLYGLRPREIVTLTAGSGIGKSQLASEIAYDLAVSQRETVGYIALEEGLGRTGLRFMGLHVNKPLHLPGYELTPDERKAAFEATLGTGRVWLYDHFGSLDSDNLLGKMRYMVEGCGVRWLVLDHLSIVVSGMDLDGDERRMIDHTMTALRTFTEQTEAGLILVSHLKRPDGRGHEEGAMTSLAQLRGSAAIAQLSDAVIGAERNQQAETQEEKNTLTLRVLKNRYAGITGEGGELRYDETTGRLCEAEIDQFEEDIDAPF